MIFKRSLRHQLGSFKCLVITLTHPSRRLPLGNRSH